MKAPVPYHCPLLLQTNQLEHNDPGDDIAVNLDKKTKAMFVIIERLNRKQLKANRLEEYYSLLRSFV